MKLFNGYKVNILVNIDNINCFKCEFLYPFQDGRKQSLILILKLLCLKWLMLIVAQCWCIFSLVYVQGRCLRKIYSTWTTDLILSRHFVLQMRSWNIWKPKKREPPLSPDMVSISVHNVFPLSTLKKRKKRVFLFLAAYLLVNDEIHALKDEKNSQNNKRLEQQSVFVWLFLNCELFISFKRSAVVDMKEYF